MRNAGRGHKLRSPKHEEGGLTPDLAIDSMWYLEIKSGIN